MFLNFSIFAFIKSVVKNSSPRDDRNKQGENNVSFWEEKGGALTDLDPEKEQLGSNSTVRTLRTDFWEHFDRFRYFFKFLLNFWPFNQK